MVKSRAMNHILGLSRCFRILEVKVSSLLGEKRVRKEPKPI